MARRKKKSISRIKTAKKDFEKYWKKNRESAIKTIIISLAVVLLLILISFYLGIQIRFFIHDELLVTLDPLDISLTKHYSESTNVTFSTQVEHFAFCRNICEYNFFDISENETVDSGTSTSTSIEKSYILSSDRNGQGQKMYLYTIKCRNQKSPVCNTDEDIKIKSSLVTLNYELSDEEQILKKQLHSQLTDYLDDLYTAEQLIQRNRILLDRLMENRTEFPSEIQKLAKEKILVERDLQLYQENADELVQHWNSELYSEIQIPSTDVLSQIESQYKMLNTLIEKHNSAVSLFKGIQDRYPLLNNMLDFYVITQNNIMLAKIRAAIDLPLLNSFIDMEYDSYENILERLQSVTKSIDRFSQDYKTDSKTFHERVALELLKNEITYRYLTEMKGNLSSNLSVLSPYSEYNDILETEYSKETLLRDCNLLAASLDTIQQLNNDAKVYRQDNNISDLPNYALNISIYVNNTLSEQEVPGFNASPSVDVNISLWNAAYAPVGDNLCEDIDYSATYTLELPTDTPPTLSNQTSITNPEKRNLDENLPICCAFGSCQACCDDCHIIPVVFVHGHSMNEQNSPESSLSSFALLQEKLTDADYINAGQLDLGVHQEDIRKGGWSRSGYPITIRVSYYYITYYDVGAYTITTQKTEKIENYAIRLKEAIDLIKYRTGANKVNIVAHSMGGLVAREYVQLFGGDSVEKLIMIGTPNKGVRGNVEKYCSVFGAGNECEDMEEGSVFLKRLNAATPSTSVQYYTITSRGCDTDGVDGDGIVVAENVKLPYAENYEIEGVCNDLFGTELHSAVLNPKRYPETFEILKKILLT